MMTTNEISPAWRDWIVNNLNRGCTPQSMVESMVEANFDAAFAATCISRAVSNIGFEAPLAPVNHHPYLYEPSRVAPGNTIELNDGPIKITMRLERPDIVLVDRFLSDAECDELIAQSKQKCLPSTIVDPQSGDTRIIAERSSEGTYFQRGESALIQRLERRISDLMNWPVARGEGIQVLHYRAGAEYKPHFDYFPAHESGSAPHLAKSGQRVATLVMYLNDVDQGGETTFPEVGLSIAPKKGSAAYFAYVNSLGQVDPATLHAGAPVVRGEKWIATKWMRQYKY